MQHVEGLKKSAKLLIPFLQGAQFLGFPYAETNAHKIIFFCITLWVLFISLICCFEMYVFIVFHFVEEFDGAVIASDRPSVFLVDQYARQDSLQCSDNNAKR